MLFQDKRLDHVTLPCSRVLVGLIWFLFFLLTVAKSFTRLLDGYIAPNDISSL